MAKHGRTLNENPEGTVPYCQSNSQQIDQPNVLKLHCWGHALALPVGSVIECQAQRNKRCSIDLPVHPFTHTYVENQPEVLMQRPLSMQISFCSLVPLSAQQELNSASGLQGWYRPENVSKASCWWPVAYRRVLARPGCNIFSPSGLPGTMYRGTIAQKSIAST